MQHFYNDQGSPTCLMIQYFQDQGFRKCKRSNILRNLGALPYFQDQAPLKWLRIQHLQHQGFLQWHHLECLKDPGCSEGLEIHHFKDRGSANWIQIQNFQDQGLPKWLEIRYLGTPHIMHVLVFPESLMQSDNFDEDLLKS